MKIMKFANLKPYSLLTAALCTALSLSFAVSAEEELITIEESIPFESPVLSAGESYEVDVNADSVTELLTFETYTNETDDFSRAVLKVYLDGALVFEQTEEDWSYHWTLDEFTLKDGNSYLLACSQSDNDWNVQSLVLFYSPESQTYEPIADLTEMTRESETLTDYRISSWGRCAYVSATSGTEFTVAWTDTLMSTGILTVPVTYEITDGVVSIADQPMLLDSELEWTVWNEFDTYGEPGSEELAFHVSADEVVSLTETLTQDGITYVKCVNQNGDEGWYADPEQYVSGGVDEDGNYLGGYFREAFFAG